MDEMKKPQKSFLELIFLLAVLLSLFSLSSSQQRPLTKAEASNFNATSLYADVREFMAELERQNSLLRVEILAKSPQGRDVPLLIIGDPPPASPRALKYDKRGTIYIQANIHGGEVEGKEACLMLARDIILAQKPPYLDKLVILIAPIFNTDGNEKISSENRRSQAGPEKGVGVRHNGQNLDLNRDSMKLESPELQGLVQNVLERWDPLLLVDCHTTNGSYHEEPVTYSWPLNPNGDQTIISYMREKMLPAIDSGLKEKYNTLSIPYGDFVDARDPEKGWQTFSAQPRYVTNYIGLRNRLSILNENYSYADFKTRVFGCYNFLLSILDYCQSHLEEISNLVAQADNHSIQKGINSLEKASFATEFEAKAFPEKLSVQSWEMEVIPREGTWPEVKKKETKRTYTLPYFADFAPKRTVFFPAAYLLTVSDPEIIAKLHQHGLVVEKLREEVSLEVESFRIKEIKSAERLYQGHRLNKLSGEYVLEKRLFPRGTIIVSTSQPLANLAAYLLEPESDDGLIVWNFFDRYLIPQWGGGFEVCPVHKLLKPTNLVKEILR